VDVAAERIGGSLQANRALMLRAGASLDLPFRTSIRLSTERNPFILPGAAGSAWVSVASVTKSISLPRLLSGGTRGRIYRDLNGNGRLDRGEPGLAGVSLRRGPDIAVTDGRGVFHLPGNRREPFEADARSLPIGWLLPATTLSATTREIGATPVAPLHVTLTVDSTGGSRVPASDLANVVVSARDSTGWEWTARRTSDSTLIFDALPPGTYRVEIDVSGTRERLQAVDPSRSVILATGRAPAPLRILLRSRQLRFSSPRRGPQ
jgi:hypothetical protein